MKTKDKILKEGLKQFNQGGVEVITTRHIAKAIGISQGNLHYHFPNKDMLIEALFDDFIESVQAASRNVPNTLFSKEEVLLSMEENFQIMHTYRFLFRDNETVWRRLPKLKKQMLELLASKKQEIKMIIKIYVGQRIFRADISPSQIDFLADQFVFTIASWLNAAEYLEIHTKQADYFARFTFRQWLPYLEKSEMPEWEALL